MSTRVGNKSGASFRPKKIRRPSPQPVAPLEPQKPPEPAPIPHELSVDYEGQDDYYDESLVSSSAPHTSSLPAPSTQSNSIQPGSSLLVPGSSFDLNEPSEEPSSQAIVESSPVQSVPQPELPETSPRPSRSTPLTPGITFEHVESNMEPSAAAEGSQPQTEQLSLQASTSSLPASQETSSQPEAATHPPLFRADDSDDENLGHDDEAQDHASKPVPRDEAAHQDIDPDLLASNRAMSSNSSDDDRDPDFELKEEFPRKRLRFASQEADGIETDMQPPLPSAHGDDEQTASTSAAAPEVEKAKTSKKKVDSNASKQARKPRKKPETSDPAAPQEPRTRRKRKNGGVFEGRSERRIVKKPRDSVSLSEDPTPINPEATAMTDLTVDNGKGRMTSRAIEASRAKMELKAKRKRMREKMKRRARGEEVSEDEEETEMQEPQQEQHQLEYPDPHQDGVSMEVLPGSDDEAQGEEGEGQQEEEGEEEEEEPEFVETNLVAGFRIKDGQIVIDNDSMQVARDQHDADADDTIIESSLHDRRVTSASYSTRRSSTRWTADDTVRFYEALRKYGSNLELVALCFPGRDRRQIRSKWRREDKLNPDKITEALMNKAPLDMGDVERETGLDLSGPAPEDPMEPFYFDRPGGPLKPLPEGLAIEDFVGDDGRAAPVSQALASRPSAAQQKKRVAAPPSSAAHSHKIKGLNAQQRGMLNFVQSEVVEDD